MKMMNSFADSVQETKRETPQHKDTYRAPRLVTLGTAVDLVQGVTGAPAVDYYGYIRV